jgi:hypothetical protein
MLTPEWMKETLPLMQWASTTILAFSSLTVAVVAVTFGYRNLRGWQPFILVTRQGGATDSQDKDRNLVLSFEIWNRRKYPIILQAIHISFGNKVLEGSANWTWLGKEVVSQGEPKSIDSTKAEKFNLSLRVLDDADHFVWQQNLTIRAWYFDPVSNDYKETTHASKFMSWRR